MRDLRRSAGSRGWANEIKEEQAMTNVAILGAGGIARKMAETLRLMKARGDGVELYAVGSRDLGRAEAFAREEGFVKAYGSYEELLEDKAVELVYIATPHSHHGEQIEMCVEHGKAVLCEKAFTATAAQAERALALAKTKGVLVTEAIWTRYVPMRRMLDDLLASGKLGAPRLLTANLGYTTRDKERIRRPELAGGALLDVGVYVLNFAAMTFGNDVERMESSVRMMDTGVDLQESVTLHYTDGRMAELMATAACNTSRRCWIYGDRGCAEIDNVNNPRRITLYANANDPASVTQVIDAPPQLTGYEYEVLSCLRALKTGALECPEMPHQETLRIMRWMDGLRHSWGMRYPFE